MFVSLADNPPDAHPRAGSVVGASDIRAWSVALLHVARDVPDGERIDLLRALEELKCSVEAAQSQISVDLDESRCSEARARGARPDEVGRGVAAEIALARRVSPTRATHQLAVDRALVIDMPHAFVAMRRGKLSWWRASLLARETSCLTAADRRQVDAELCADVEKLESFGDRRLAAEARRLAAKLDPRSVVERARRAETERRVTIRPAPDTMCYLTALLPVAEGVGAYAALVAASDSARAAGDPRSRGQVMADALVGRIRQGEAIHPGVPAVTVGLVMTDRTFFGDDETAADVEGYGPIPAELARDLLRRATGAHEVTWLYRLYTSPRTGELVNLDDRPIDFRTSMVRLIRLRDRHCRTPWCEAPIRHTDHVVAKRAGGRATRDNGQGLCEACNYTKETRGWTARPRPGPGGHVIDITTPTGHHYTSRPPALVAPRWTQHRPGVWTRAA